VLLELQWKLELELSDRIRRIQTLRSALEELSAGMVDLLESEEYPGVVRDMFRMNARPSMDPLIEAQPFPLIEELARIFAEGAERGELRAGLSPRARTTAVYDQHTRLHSCSPPDWDRRADVRAITQLYLADDA
jgi:hypothetical protein